MRDLGLEHPENKFRFISKCFDSCVKSFSDKHFNAFERECMMTCLENVITSHIELATSLDPAKGRDYSQLEAHREKNK